MTLRQQGLRETAANGIPPARWVAALTQGGVLRLRGLAIGGLDHVAGGVAFHPENHVVVELGLICHATDSSPLRYLGELPARTAETDSMLSCRRVDRSQAVGRSAAYAALSQC